MLPGRIALVGDFRADVVAHRAIQQCFELARKSTPDPVEGQWLPTDQIVPGDERALESFCAVWCVPASPYRSTDGALWAIRYARTHAVPFLGTCGGYQHALLEYARNVLNLKTADHAENNPAAVMPLLDRMQCSLTEQSQEIFAVSKEFRALYGADSGVEGFCCSYGLNPKYERLFRDSPMQIVARSADGQARAFRLEGHPFFIGTHFQPERHALAGSIHPLVNAFFAQS